MNNDLILVLGLIIGLLTLPSILSALKEGTAPRVAAFSAVVSGALIVFAISNQPGGYSITDLPRVFEGVVSSFAR
ncbi:MAG: hypothetical protein AAGA12_04875 [Pseudomonadota bacterium]